MWPETVRKSDLDINYFSGTGAGGQHRNKHQNCCRITHKTTGISAQCQEFRSKEQNTKRAFRRLAKKLVPLMKQEIKKARFEAGTNRIRTYHEPQARVTDHRVKDKQWTYEGVLYGNDLGKIIDACSRITF